MKKVQFLNKKVQRKFYKIFTGLIGLLTILQFFFEVTFFQQWLLFLGFCFCIIVLYISIWLHEALFNKVTKLRINNSDVEILIGNIFDVNPGTISVIPFNEYFDTIVDDNIIAKATLNGKYIKDFYLGNEESLRNKIASCPNLESNVVEKNVPREKGFLCYN